MVLILIIAVVVMWKGRLYVYELSNRNNQGFVFMCILLGINPTLVLSVISAPIWIFIVYFSNQLTKVIVNGKIKRRKK